MELNSDENMYKFKEWINENFKLTNNRVIYLYNYRHLNPFPKILNYDEEFDNEYMLDKANFNRPFIHLINIFVTYGRILQIEDSINAIDMITMEEFGYE